MTNEHDDTRWESAMSRDFDARVRDLDEAPLDLDAVKGKAVTIRRKRRIAVAGGVLAAAAVAVPVAVVAANSAPDTSPDVPVATNSGTASPTRGTDTGDVDYVEGDTWHRADGILQEV